MEIIPMVVDKNTKDGKYCSSSDAQLFINDEPIARTLTCNCGRGQEVHHNNMVCVAMRGRNPEHHSKTRRGRVQEGGDVTPTLTAGSSENINVVETRYRIRKLTPKECWRLMGYTDTDFEKAKASGVSNSQLYKQAGNAIVKQVLMAIFSQMGIKGVKAWND